MTSVGPHRDASVVAIDIGGTKVDVAIVLADGSITERDRIDVRGAGEHLFDDIARLVRERSAQVGVSAVGVACAGPMTQGGVEVSPINIPQWQRFPLAASLRACAAVPVFIDGDVRALALAEGRFGSAVGVANYASLVVSTGVGGALVLDGSLLNGATGNSGHLGHLTVADPGHQCSCGARGCLEAEVSGWAIRKNYGIAPESASEELRHRVATLVGSAIGTLASVLDFTQCFVGGSVALGFGPSFFATATEAARERVGLSFARDVVVRPTGLGVDGSLLGAALVAWRGLS